MITAAEYEKKKEKLLKEFEEIKKEGTVELKKSTTNLFRYRKSKSKKLDVKKFNNVISIDKENLIAEVEGMTTYETFVDEALKFGVMPAVVPELKTITVGGVTSGVGLESSSFRYGFVHESVEEMEILTGTGVVIARKDNEHKDLFYGFPNTYGSLGYILKVKIKLAPIKKYVKISRQKFTDVDKFFQKSKELTLKYKNDPKIGFLEGMGFGKNEMYIAICEWVDEAPYTSNYNYMNIYYKTIQTKKEDYLKVKDYIWRFDADWIWCSYHFGMENKVLRFLLGWFMLSSKMYHRIMRWNRKLGLAKLQFKLDKTETVIQDVELPTEKAGEFYSWYIDVVNITPVILGTTTVPDPKQFTFFPLDPEKVNVNIGFYDFRKTEFEPGHYNKLIEKKARELGGHKLLYSSCYYTEEEFWSIYDKNKYDELKNKYDPNKVFLGLHEKVVKRG